MISRLSLLDYENRPAQVFDLDALSGRRDAERRDVTVGGEGSMIELSGVEMRPNHLRLAWQPRASSWVLSSGGPSKTVAVNNVVLRDDEKRALTVSSCLITVSGLAFAFERRPAPPLFQGEPIIKLPIPPEGLIIGRGAEPRPGEAPPALPRPKLSLDHEIFTISSQQCEIVREGADVFLINHHDHPRYRTKLNADQGFTKQRLVFGDCIQIPDYDYYTFQFDGSSLVHIGEGGAIQARGLTRIASDGFKILADVDFDLQCGEFVGVLGGSGQGKSTLMKAVCGMAPSQGGQVYIEGRRITGPDDMSKTGIGYVPQEDIVHRELTVREALIFGARLRVALPARQLHEAVDTVLRTLSLTEHQAKPVRVLSGGQCKRVSIASELIMNPRFLFLDEPTSGLDPQTESELMTELSVLARNKRMGIFCTTHVLQNSHLFKAIVWVHGGRIIFLGRSAEAVRYFLMDDPRNSVSGSLRRNPSSRTSTSGSSHTGMSVTIDEFKDDELLGKLPKVYGELGRLVQRRASEIRNESSENVGLGKRLVDARVAEELADNFNRSGKRPHLLPVDDSGGAASTSRRPPQPTVWTTLWVLLLRQWHILIADPRNYLFLTLQALIIGVLVGWVSDNLVFQMFITVIATLWFGCSNGAQQIVGELPIFRRERLAGVGLHVYLVSKLVFQTAITSLQALLLFFTVLCTHHLAHPEILPTNEKPDAAGSRLVFKQLFFSNVPELMTEPKSAADLAAERAAEQVARSEANAGTANPVAFGTAQVQTSPDDFAVEDAPDYQPPAAEQVTHFTNPTGLRARDFQFTILSRLASFFRVKENVLDELGVKRSDDPPPAVERRRSWTGFLTLLLTMRFAALLAAAVTGVALGLLVSASVASVTQAVMWVPLILIPQILFGGFVVTSPEMDRFVLWFSHALPSYNLQRLMDTSNVFGRTTPQMTNKTRIPAFLAAPPNDEETVRWPDESGQQTEKYDRISEVSKSWQNLLVLRDRVGARPKTPERDMVEDRRDVAGPKGTPFVNLGPAALSWGILIVWLGGCYAIIVVNLSRNQSGS